MLEHGGNLIKAAQQYNIPLADWLDLSTGINPNPFPIPPIPTSTWQRLPAPNSELVSAACAYYGCQSLLPTAGSQAALQVLPKLRPPCHIAMPRTMYQEHAHAWQNNGHTVTLFDAFPDDKVLNSVDTILLCNPNNPTGQHYSKQQLLQWHQQLSKRGAWLIVDEAFMDVTPENSVASESHLAGLFVLRSLGKFFGLAGARVGFLLAHPNALNSAQEIIGPWPITGPSQLVATLTLQDVTWQASTRKKLSTSSQQLQQLLKQTGLTPQGGTDLFQYSVTPQAAAIHQALAKQAIWTRLFKQPSALRLGLPPDTHWHQLESALQTLR